MTSALWHARAEQVALDGLDTNTVDLGIENDGRDGKGVDLSGDHGSRARLHRRDGNEPGAGREIDHAFARDHLRMIEHEARERLTARPGKGPEWWRQALLAELLLRLLPDRQAFLGEVELHFGHERWGEERVLARMKVARSWIALSAVTCASPDRARPSGRPRPIPPAAPAARKAANC